MAGSSSTERKLPLRTAAGGMASAAIARWAAPDLALSLALFTLAYSLTVFDGPRKLFRDSDTGWHIRSGEHILASHSVPFTDPFSFSRPAAPWFAWEWGTDALMGAAHRVAGLTGVCLLYAAAIAFSVWLWVRLTWAAGGSFLLACALCSPMLSTANLHWLARPHVLGWVLLLAFLIWMVRTADAPPPSMSAAEGVLLFGYGALWANLHASFLLAPAIALLWSAEAWVRPLLWDIEPSRERSKARWFACAAILTAAGSFVNPYGWRLHEHVVRYLADRDLLDRVGEFQSFNFHSEGSLQILLTVALGMLGGAMELGHKRPARFALLFVLALGALRSARGLPLLALAGLPLANAAMTQALRRSSALRPALHRRLSAFLAYDGRLLVLDGRLGGAALIPFALAAAFLFLNAATVKAGTGFPPEEFPVFAAERVAAMPEGARILAPDKFGGYLIYRFDGARKVFFDGRSDFYGGAFLKQYIRLVQVRPGWHETLGLYSFTHALLPVDAPLGPALERDGWTELYRDSTAVLLRAPRAS